MNVLNGIDKPGTSDPEDRVTDLVNEFVVRVCGPDHANLTYGQRDALLANHAETLGWYLVSTGQGWALSRNNKIQLCSSLRPAAIDSETEKC